VVPGLPPDEAREEAVTAILKTLPTRFARGEIERFFGLDGKPCWTTYFFTLGRGRPKATPEPTQLYFTHKGILVGHFDIAEIVQNAGQLPKLLDPTEFLAYVRRSRGIAIEN
jgi:hypothetical protein